MVQSDGEAERMPTLEEVFQQFPNTPINLDVKGDDDELMKMVRKMNPQQLTIANKLTTN